MRVLHVSTIDYGGAYIAAKRISNSLNDNEVSSKVIVRTKTKKCSDDQEIINGFIKKAISKIKNAFNLLLSDENVIIDFFGTNICKCIDIRDADVIVLHWINSFVSLKVAEKIVKFDKPVIWVLHDMWPFTGGCHYDMECGRYENDCENCVVAKRSIAKALAHYSKRRKNEIVCRKNVTLVGPSRWITECARKAFGNRCNIVYIPNPIDTNFFQPNNSRRIMREKYRINPELPLVLFAAMNVLDKRKGFDIVCEAFNELKSCNIHLCVLGMNSKSFSNIGNCTCLELVSDEQQMIDIYSMADVFVIPSRQENLSNSVLEAMSCELPVVAFNIGGMSDMIVHKKTGYLAEPFSADDLKTGIMYCLDNATILGKSARESVQKFFDKSVIASKYMELMRNNTDEMFSV